MAILCTTALAMLLLASGDLADMTVILMLLVLRRDPVEHDHFVALSAIPVIGAVVSIAAMFSRDGEVFERAGLLLSAESRSPSP